ncbi:MAG TPA: glycosyltransferase family 4 protein [Balneolales bacterium]|nr:glycosyltransferase family 4 protein [Balneolales bacterium]
MKILFITDNFVPEVNAPATRTYEHCREWVEWGTEITVITCVPNFPQGKVYKGYKNKLFQVEYIDGIKVIRVWSYIAANKGFIKRILDYLSFSFMAFITGLFQKADIIIATSPQFFTTWSAYGLSLIKRKPWIFELRDLWPESIKTVGVMKENSLYKSLERIELFLYRKANLVIPNTDAFKANLTIRGINADKIQVVPNGANLELFYPRAPQAKLLERLKTGNKLLIGYIGTHGMAHNLDFILKSALKLQDIDKELHFLFIGDGAQKKNLLKMADENNIKNVTFLDPIPKEKIPDYLSVIDISLVPLKKAETFTKVIPSKIFESAAMSKPILLGVEGQAEKIIKKYNAGLCFEPENEQDFIDNLLNFKRNRILMKDYGKNGLSLAKDYDRKILAQQMLHLIYEVVNKSSIKPVIIFKEPHKKKAKGTSVIAD